MKARENISNHISAAVDCLIRAGRHQKDDRRHEKVLDLVQNILEFQRFTLITGQADIDKAARMMAYADDALNAFLRRTRGMESWKNLSPKAKRDFEQATFNLKAAHRFVRRFHQQGGERC